MITVTPPLCWICRAQPGDTSEHRFKASDIRAKAPAVSQKTPVYLQRGSKATNIKVGSAKSKVLTFEQSICADCNNARTQPYDKAWENLSKYLQQNWHDIKRRSRFDLSKPFPGGTRAAALQVHLYFVKLFGCKLNADNVGIDLAPFSKALLSGTMHPEVSILVADSFSDDGKMLMYDSEVHLMRNQVSEIHGAVWLYLVHPVAIKVGYIKTGAALHLPGNPWHPKNPNKIVKISPYPGGTEPLSGRKALLS